jgi:Cu2+-exporting ATPase
MDDRQAVAVISMADQVRERAWENIHRSQEQGIQPVIITGDAETVARTVVKI